MDTSKIANPIHPISELVSRRWSPYAFSGRPVPPDDLLSIFEAARWAPSSYNEQPWSYIVGVRDDREQYERILSCLVEANQAWARAAPVLAIGCTNSRFTRNAKPNAAAQHDLGLAAGNICLEATARGIFVHQMIGILPDRVRELFDVPQNVDPLTGFAIGYPADSGSAPAPYGERDLQPRTRKTLDQFVFGPKWGQPAGFLEKR